MKPSDVVAAAFKATEDHDVEATLNLFTEDGVWDLVPLTSGKGREEIRALIEPMAAMMTNMEVVVGRQIEVGNVVMHERVDRFEIDGIWREIPVAGVFEIRDDKIALWRDFFDLATFKKQLRPNPQPNQ
jgi:limonene-1,2-epoxide hydrolase